MAAKILLGRKKLYSSLTLEQLNGNNAAELIRQDLENNILPMHLKNAVDIQFLMDYYKGYHPDIMNRVKDVRPDINNKVPINYAKQFTRDIVSYTFGKPLDYVNRDGSERDSTQKLAHILDAENKNLTDVQITTDLSNFGIAHRGVYVDESKKNGSSIQLLKLDSRHTAVVHSPDPRIGPLYCFSFVWTEPSPTGVAPDKPTIYTVNTKTHQFVYEAPGDIGPLNITHLELQADKTVEIGFNGELPIIEYINNDVRMGDWESEIALMDALDLLTSDSLNDVEAYVNSILVALGFELDADSYEALEEYKTLNIADIPPGVQPMVKYIAEQLDAQSVDNLREWLEATLRIIVGVPDRKSKGGGGADTGNAVFLRDGWQDIDLVAAAKEQFFIESDKNALTVVLYILQTFDGFDKELNIEDIEIKFSRTKQANLQAKAQAYSTLVGASFPIAPADALEMADLTNSTEDVIMRSKDFQDEQRQAQLDLESQQAEIADKNAQTNTDNQSSGNSAANQSQKLTDEQGNKVKGTNQ